MTAGLLERQGSQEPTTRVIPDCPDDLKDTSDGQDAVAFHTQFDHVPDLWQSDLCNLWMTRDRRTGRWLSGTWGISVPRQNGKNGTLETIELYMMVVLGLRILHTAHQVKTAQKHFRALKRLFGDRKDDPHARYPELNRLVKEIRSVNGQEAIFLWDPDTRKDLGSVEISARSKGSARGFTNDVLVIDEAQHLKDEHLEALRPAISAAPSGDPIAIYMGTPPKEGALLEDGEGAAFMRVRDAALAGDSRAAWMEFGLDVDIATMTDDQVLQLAQNQENWFRVNPALGIRLSVQTLTDELVELGARSFCRERLNVWPSPTVLSSAAFNEDEWAGAVVGRAPSNNPLDAIGLDMDKDGRMWVGVALREGKLVHVELLPQDLLERGQDAAIEWLWDRCKKRQPVVIPSDSGATILEAALRAKGMKVYNLAIKELVQSSAGFEQAVKDGELTHLDDPVLSKSVAESGLHTLSNGLKKFGRNGEYGGAPLGAVACARFGAVKWSRRRRTGKSRFG